MIHLAQKKKKERGKEKKPINTTPLYIALVLLFVLYFIFQSNPALSIVFGVAAFFLIIAVLGIEIYNGVREEGYKKNMTEIVIAIAAVLLFWLALRFLTGTSNPIDVVPSCSMLPVLNRGDMILLQGANQNGIRAPTVNVTRSQWNGSFSTTGQEALQCVAYNISNGRIRVSQFLRNGFSVGLLASNGQSAYVVPPSQQSALVKYTCGTVSVKFQNGTVEQEASTTAITINNQTISGDRNNSILVYQTAPQDLFYREGDSYIVHRAYAVINASGSYYVLTKGDNNPGLDIQYYNTPPNLTYVQGRVIGGVPYLGYLKLILSSSFVEPTGCNYTTQN